MPIFRPAPGACVALLCTVTLFSAATAATGPDEPLRRVRSILSADSADERWGADAPREELLAEHGPMEEATFLKGSGHAVMIRGLGGASEPDGSTLSLIHVKLVRARADVYRCAVDWSDTPKTCPAEPASRVFCRHWRVKSRSVLPALEAARRALYVRVYEKKYSGGPREEYEDGSMRGFGFGSGSGSSADFVAAASLVERRDGKRLRVSAEWAGYHGSHGAGHYVRPLAAVGIVDKALPDRGGRLLSPAERGEPKRAFAHLLETLPLDEKYWWWVRERMVTMSAELGTRDGVPRLIRFLDLERLAADDREHSGKRTRGYALDALARITGDDERCAGKTRRTDDEAAKRWRMRPEAPEAGAR